MAVPTQTSVAGGTIEGDAVVKADDFTSELAATALKLERTGCFGYCPAYRLTIYSDGSVIYGRLPRHVYYRIFGQKFGNRQIILIDRRSDRVALAFSQMPGNE